MSRIQKDPLEPFSTAYCDYSKCETSKTMSGRSNTDCFSSFEMKIWITSMEKVSLKWLLEVYTK